MSTPDPYAVGLAVLKRFTAHNESLKAQGQRLQDAIRAFVEQHVGPVPIRAEAVHSMLTNPQVLAKLGRQVPPSLRTVRRHLSALRAARGHGNGA